GRGDLRLDGRDGRRKTREGPFERHPSGKVRQATRGLSPKSPSPCRSDATFTIEGGLVSPLAPRGRGASPPVGRGRSPCPRPKDLGVCPKRIARLGRRSSGGTPRGRSGTRRCARVGSWRAGGPENGIGPGHSG